MKTLFKITLVFAAISGLLLAGSVAPTDGSQVVVSCSGLAIFGGSFAIFKAFFDEGI